MEKHIHDPKHSFKNLINGRLDRRFFTVFIFELMRDYLIFKSSYSIPNMRDLRVQLDPILPKTDKNKIPLGTKTSQTTFLGLESFEAKRFIELDKDTPYKILIPKNFNSRVLSEDLLIHNYKIETIESKKVLPKSILDLKSNINARLISDWFDLDNKIKTFNDNMLNYLENFKKLINNNYIAETIFDIKKSLTLNTNYVNNTINRFKFYIKKYLHN